VRLEERNHLFVVERVDLEHGSRARSPHRVDEPAHAFGRRRLVRPEGSGE
jgi:hypothetical protein